MSDVDRDLWKQDVLADPHDRIFDAWARHLQGERWCVGRLAQIAFPVAPRVARPISHHALRVVRWPAAFGDILQEPHSAVGEDATPESLGVVRSPRMWHCATIAGGRESCTVQESREAEFGESDQWRQSAFGKDGDHTRLQGQRAFGGDGKDTRLQGHQATGVLQTVRGEAGSITRRAGGCQASARRACRRRSRRVPRDRRGALATSQLPAWRALVLPLQLHQAKDGDQAGFSMV